MFTTSPRFTILFAALCGLVLSCPSIGRADETKDLDDAIAAQVAQAMQAQKDFEAIKAALSQINPTVPQVDPAVADGITQKMARKKEAKGELKKVEARLVENKQYLEQADVRIKKLDRKLNKLDLKVAKDDAVIAGFDAIEADAIAERDRLTDAGRQAESDAVVDHYNEVELPRQQVIIDRRNDLADEFNEVLEEHEEERLAFNAKLDEIRDLLVVHTQLHVEIRDLDLKLGRAFDQLRQAGIDPAVAAALFDGKGTGVSMVDPPGVPPVGPSGPVQVPDK